MASAIYVTPFSPVHMCHLKILFKNYNSNVFDFNSKDTAAQQSKKVLIARGCRATASTASTAATASTAPTASTVATPSTTFASAPTTVSSAPSATTASTASTSTERLSLLDFLLRHCGDDLIGDLQVLDAVTANEALGHIPELVAVLVGPRHIAHGYVHKHVAADQRATVCVTILQLDQDFLVFSRFQKRKREHLSFSTYRPNSHFIVPRRLLIHPIDQRRSLMLV